MLYTGKLAIDRDKTIRRIGEALDKINRDGVKIELDVYTTSHLSEEARKALSPHVHVKGAIPQSEVAQVQREADVLLFAEAIDGPHSRTARLSFSTKLTDYFRSGKCILAVGCSDVAPMEYLREEDAALVATDEAEIEAALRRLTETPEIIGAYAQKAFACGQRNHDKKEIQKRLFETLNR